MKTSTVTRLGLTVAMSAALAAMSFASHAQHGADVSAPHKAEKKGRRSISNSSIVSRSSSRNAQQLEQQKRLAHYRYQQAYYEQLRQQQARLENDRYDYQTNEYGADQLRRASNTGYQKGYEAGRADKQDNWPFDYRQSFAYQDANSGFDGRHVRQDDYNTSAKDSSAVMRMATTDGAPMAPVPTDRIPCSVRC